MPKEPRPNHAETLRQATLVAVTAYALDHPELDRARQPLDLHDWLSLTALAGLPGRFAMNWPSRCFGPGPLVDSLEAVIAAGTLIEVSRGRRPLAVLAAGRALSLVFPELTTSVATALDFLAARLPLADPARRRQYLDWGRWLADLASAGRLPTSDLRQALSGAPGFHAQITPRLEQVWANLHRLRVELDRQLPAPKSSAPRKEPA